MYDIKNNKLKDYEYIKARLQKTDPNDWKSVVDLVDDLCQINVGIFWRDEKFGFPRDELEVQFNQAIHSLFMENSAELRLIIRGCFMREIAYDANSISRLCTNEYAESMINFLTVNPDPRYFNVI